MSLISKEKRKNNFGNESKRSQIN